MMTLEWLRRQSPVFASNIETYLNSTGPIVDVEKSAAHGGEPSSGKASVTTSVSLGIGSLKGLK
jgi:hypothetical protein